MGIALILENAGYQHAREKHEYWRTFTRDAFYVRTPAWKARLLARGLSLFDQLVARATASGK